MRLITRRIWRAFPELDRFDDERCERFVRAARRGRSVPLRIWWIVLRAFCVAPVLAVSVGVVVPLERWARRNTGDLGVFDASITGAFIAIAVGATLAILVWLYAGHWLLRYRIEWVLYARARCGGCGYELIGLPVSATFQVTCPECMLQASVHPALVELAKGPQGLGVFAPHREPSP